MIVKLRLLLEELQTDINLDAKFDHTQATYDSLFVDDLAQC